MSDKTSLSIGTVALFLSVTLASTCLAAECRSVAGQLNGQRVSAVRSVKLSANSIVLGGTFEGKQAPRRRLPCKVLAKGVLCEATFDGVLVSVMTNGKRMIEAVTEPATSRQLANLAYVCDQVMKP
jgi:hypothetical protein